MPQSKNPGASPGASNQLRKHYYLDREVIIAPLRDLRPSAFKHDAPHTAARPKACPFCHNDETALYRYPAVGDWQVKVVPNKYPVLTLDNPEAYGTHEVIIETPDNREFSQLTRDEQLAVLRAYRHRLAALSRLKEIRYVQIWKNDGPMAGASIAHAHSQLMALSLVPPSVVKESQGLDAYRNEHGTCAICDIILWEESQLMRMIYADKHIVAIAPYAGSAPYGVWIVPRRHEGQFGNLTSGELASIVTVLAMVSAKLDHEQISFNWFLANSLPHEDHHFMWKIEPRGTPWGGTEMGTGLAVNPVPPEYAALWYQGKA